MDIHRRMGLDGLDIMRTYVDALYAVHVDIKIHTGGLNSLGKGVMNMITTKQKLNTKSSTEAELVGASDFIPWAVWLKRILEC